MRRSLVSTAVALVVGGAVTLGACGADDNPLERSEAETGTTTDRAEVTLPEITTPDFTVPDLTLPDVTIPDLTLPDVTFPDLSLPDITFPDLSLPDITFPDLSIPDLSLPDVTLPSGGEMTSVWEQLLRQVFPELDDDQIACLAEHMPDFADGPGLSQEVFQECDISAADLGG